MAELEVQVPTLLEAVQTAIYEKAVAFRDSHTYDVSSYDELKEAVETGFARAWWAGDAEDEARVKDETRATVRCIPTQQPGGAGTCVYTGRPATEVAVFGKSY